LYTEVKPAPFANEQHHVSQPIQESGHVAGMENGKSTTHSAFQWEDQVGGLLGRKKRGSRWAAPFMNGMNLFAMFISIFPGNFSRAPWFHWMNRSFFRTCYMCSDLTFRLLLLRESAPRFSAIPELTEQ
jgi:hypothetical protein